MYSTEAGHPRPTAQSQTPLTYPWLKLAQPLPSVEHVVQSVHTGAFATTLNAETQASHCRLRDVEGTTETDCPGSQFCTGAQVFSFAAAVKVAPSTQVSQVRSLVEVG